MAHSILSDEINAGKLKDSSWVSLNLNKFILYHILKNTLGVNI